VRAGQVIVTAFAIPDAGLLPAVAVSDIRTCCGRDLFMDIAALRRKLSSLGQDHVLRFVDSMDHSARRRYVTQLQSLDWENLSDLSRQYVRSKTPPAVPRDIQPVQAYPAVPDETRRELYQRAEQRGRELLAQGAIAAFLVAGGQGTRLGYDGPKGEYPITPVKNKPLFQVFAEQLRAHSLRCGRLIPWYIMTSDINDIPTRAFFQKHEFFGYDESAVFFFQQGMMPAFANDGRLLLTEKDSLALSPDGHGGSLRALQRSGALDDMRARGVLHLSYFQVDNPLVRCIDPLFLGLHDLTGSEMSSKTIPKASPLEKVGNFVVGDGVLQVIEYSDLPEELALRTKPDGTPILNAASIAIHALRISFVERLNEGGRLNLPWHRAQKKVPCIDDHGNPVKPDRPNAVKLEQFVFDAIPLAKNAIVYTTDRAEEFSPVKNAEGSNSPETCRRDQTARSARWLTAAGAKVAMQNGFPDAMIEISPMFAVDAEELRSKPLPIKQIKSGESVYLA
jgi:UDP-N-acetylglucosamine/UDP-N-acetylgalactosamine diphosphorylase